MSVKAAEQRLSAIVLNNKKVLVVGGTSGIGKAIAKRFSDMGASVVVSGRNDAAAKSLIDQAESDGKGPIKFKRLDASVISNCKEFCKEFQNENDKLDYLVISAGMMRLGGRIESQEGLDDKMTLHYYSRFSLIKNLAFLLNATAEENGDARVMSVLAAGHGKLVSDEDWDLKKNYGIKQCADACTLYNDLMVDVRSFTIH